MIKKLGAEFLGTAILVYVACGVATVTLGTWAVGSHRGNWGTNGGILATALTFGLVLMALAYAIGPISGCHVNPAVTIGMWISKRMTFKEAAGYWAAQFAGAIIAAGCLALTFKSSPLYNKTQDGLGADGYGPLSRIHIGVGGAFIFEVVITTIFVFVILRVTTKNAPAAVSGLVIGLTLAFIHLFGIPITGTSVNPARSFGPALFVGGTALHQVWLFILAPLIGGAIAAALHRGFQTAGD
jgi:aquaporin Z